MVPGLTPPPNRTSLNETLSEITWAYKGDSPTPPLVWYTIIALVNTDCGALRGGTFKGRDDKRCWETGLITWEHHTSALLFPNRFKRKVIIQGRVLSLNETTQLGDQNVGVRREDAAARATTPVLLGSG